MQYLNDHGPAGVRASNFARFLSARVLPNPVTITRIVPGWRNAEIALTTLRILCSTFRMLSEVAGWLGHRTASTCYNFD